jgi:hypothetical protein
VETKMDRWLSFWKLVMSLEKSSVFLTRMPPSE